ncbi:hypothetical protein PMZ80_002731 [Knufia obscura]|uniref:BZIP transcription factor n=2 Tax=Knufia TaxID=430999 RepID=A0AAN8EDC1_9EURO|nr:hypothetical protein PMZ80_002731 [Knufia obscura]KAK5951505.1 hypothetical protein OHC33_007561 [Knufia fluminis]
MSGSVSPTTISVHPEPVNYISNSLQQHSAQDSSPLSSASSSASNSESELNRPSTATSSLRKSRMDRPRMAERQRSSSIIIPKGRDTFQREKPEYPPDDARAMSPRRNSEDLERLELGVRKSLQAQAHTLQSSLQALATRIDEVRLDHDRLENENRLLQEYIGGLTRSMSKENLGRSSSTRKGKK